MKYTFSQLLHTTTHIFKALGFTDQNAHLIADVLIAAEIRGIPSHGILRIPEYITLIEKSRINVHAHFAIVHETPSTAMIDADKALGMLVGKYAMETAIHKAAIAGTGWVAVKNSNHFGIAGYFSMMAVQHDMIGIAMTNANPLVAPTFAKEAMLGTNPIAVAIPAFIEAPFLADFATAPIARGKLDVLHLKKLQAASGLVQDKNGNHSNNPNILAEGGAILPLGGDEEHGGHKGYCMSAIVDILSAVLPGANFGPFIIPTLDYRDSTQTKVVGEGIGHFFGAMRVDAFRSAEEFKKSMDLWIKTFKEATPIDGQDKVFIPGEKEAELERKHKAEGVELLAKSEEILKSLCHSFNISIV